MTDDICALTASVELLAEGRFQEALAPLQLALSLGDTAPATLLNLAIAEDRAGDRERGRRLMRQVALRLPEWDEPILRLAESLRAAGEYAAAEEAYHQVLELNRNRPEALLALAGLFLARGQAQSAQPLLLHCCDVASDNAEAWNTLGLAAREMDTPELALSAFLHAQRLQPDCLKYVRNGVEAALAVKDADAELDRLTAASDLDPLNPATHFGRAMIFDHLGRKQEAIDAVEAAIELSADKRLASYLLADILVRSNNLVQAEQVLGRLAAQEPDNPVAQNNYAAVLMRMQRSAEARAILLKVLDRHGDDVSVMSNLVNTTTYVGEQAEAVKLAYRTIALYPTVVVPRRALCNNLAYLEGVGGAEMLAAMRGLSDVLIRTPQPLFDNTPDRERPLVVGLLSGTLRTHPVGWLTVAGFEALDPDQFSLVCLTQNVTSTEPMTRRFRSVAHKWIQIEGLSDLALAATARAESIDILIDLGGHGDAGRMTACANRLAPVQIKWVGMQSHSTGLPEMDWFLTDRWETPDGFEQFYSEKLLRMSDGYICYSPPSHAPDVVALPALSNGWITFGCFNNLAKITPRVIETWAIILQLVPHARLILKTHALSHTPTADGVRARFKALGVTEDRIELRGGSGHRAFLGEYGDVDIVLDPFPYSGGLTTCEALWMGVPTITLPGEIFASRHSASHLSNAGLADWVTESVSEYIEMAVARAADVPALAALRAGLRERVRRSPLCDAPRFGKSLGAALRYAWRAWCHEVPQKLP